MLKDSDLLVQLEKAIPDGNYALYADPAYPQSKYLFGGFRNPVAGSVEAEFNTRMSKVRECVEWGFKEITTQFKYLDLKANMKIYKQPVGLYYTVAIFFQNLRTTFYGNQTSAYFNLIPLSIQEYLNLIYVNKDIESVNTVDHEDNHEDNSEDDIEIDYSNVSLIVEV